MTVNIELSPEQEQRVRRIAKSRGVEVGEILRELVDRSLNNDDNGHAGPPQAPLTGEEFRARLRAAGVRFGNPQGLQELLKAWRGVDDDPDSTVEEWEQIHRNIEDGGLEFRRLQL